MKRAFLLLLFILPAFCYGQAPKKKDKTITVTPKDTAGLFSKVTFALFDNGFEPAYTDPALGLIVTKEKEHRTYNIKLRVKVQDTLIIFTGEAKYWDILGPRISSNKEDYFEPIYFGGMKGSMIRDTWDEMDRVAKSMGPVKYSK